MSKISEDFAAHSLIKVKNIDKKDFFFRVEGKDYKVEAGATMTMPGFIANHFLTKLTDKLMIEDNKTLQMASEIERGKYLSKIFVGTEASSLKPITQTTEEAGDEFMMKEGGRDQVLPEEDISQPEMTPEEAEKAFPSDEELYPDPKAKEEPKEEKEFPELDKDTDIAKKAASEAPKGDVKDEKDDSK